MKFYEYQVKGVNKTKYFQNQQNAIDFATKDTIEYYRIFRDVKLKCFDVKCSNSLSPSGEVIVYFTKEGDGSLYVCSYIQIREFED